VKVGRSHPTFASIHVFPEKGTTQKLKQNNNVQTMKKHFFQLNKIGMHRADFGYYSHENTLKPNRALRKNEHIYIARNIYSIF
jgi:hypothetical protein